jgi:MFS family permease
MAGARAINTMGLSLVMAFMAIYMVHARGLPAQTYGWVYLGANLCQSVAQGYAGQLSDRLGRRRLMLSALLNRSAVIFLLGVLVLAEASLWFIVPALAASASLRGCFEPVAYAVVADVTAPEHRVAAFGLQRMGTNFGWAIGPALGGTLAIWLPFGAVFFCATPALWLAAFAVSRVKEPQRLPTQSSAKKVSIRQALRDSLRRMDVTIIFLCATLFALCHLQLFSTLSVYTSGELKFSESDIGLLYTINGVGVVILQLPAIAIIRRLGPRLSLICGALLYVAAFVGIGAAHGWLHMAGAVLILTTGEVLLAPSQQAVVAELGNPARMGRAFGLLGFFSMLGVALAPMIGGAAYDAFHSHGSVMWGLLAVLPVALAAGYAVFAFLPRRASAL